MHRRLRRDAASARLNLATYREVARRSVLTLARWMRGSRGFRTVVIGVETAASFPATIDGGGAAVHDGVGYGQPWNE
jgi:hypothetical protein